MKGIVKDEGNSDYCIGVNKGIRGDVYSNNKVQMRQHSVSHVLCILG